MSLPTAERSPSVNRFPGNPHGPLTFEVIPQLFPPETGSSPLRIEMTRLDGVYEALLKQPIGQESSKTLGQSLLDTTFMPNTIEDPLIDSEQTHMYAITNTVDGEEGAKYLDLSTHLLLSKMQAMGSWLWILRA